MARRREPALENAYDGPQPNPYGTPLAPEAPARRGLLRRLLSFLHQALQWIILVVLIGVCIFAFYIAIIVGEAPGEDVVEGVAVQAAANASALPLPQGQPLTAAQDIAYFTAYFPGALATLPEGSGFALIEGTIADASYSGQVARVVTLRYRQQNSGDELLLRSASPPVDLARFEGQSSLTLDADTRLTMANQPALRFTLEDRQVALLSDGQNAYTLEAALSYLDLVTAAARVSLVE